MPSPETTGRDPVRITVAAHETERLVLENLNLALAGGRAVFERSRVEVAPGERVQFVVELVRTRAPCFARWRVCRSGAPAPSTCHRVVP